MLDREDRLRRARFNFKRYPPTGNTREHRQAYLDEVGLPDTSKSEKELASGQTGGKIQVT